MRVSKRIIFWISAGCLVASCIFSCQQEKKREWAVDNPHLPSSPLAAVMREMAESMEAAKPKIALGKTVVLEKELFEEIKTSAHTNPNHANLTYFGMADGFLGILDQYGKNPGKETFNNLVDGCVSCHQNFCEGPIPRIKKMKI